MILGLAITALAFVVILISWIYKRFFEVSFFSSKLVFPKSKADGVRFLHDARKPFHALLIANELLTYAKYRLFFSVSFYVLCVNHVYQYLICLSIKICGH